MGTKKGIFVVKIRQKTHQIGKILTTLILPDIHKTAFSIEHEDISS